MAKTVPAAKPALAKEAGQAVLWNMAFLPLKLLADIGVTLLQLNLLLPAAFGVLAIIRAGVSLLGTWIDLGIERALPKFIPEVQRDSGRAGVRWLLGRVMLVKLAVLVIVALLLWLLSDTFLAYLAGEVLTADKLTDADRQRLLAQLDPNGNGWIFVAAVVVLLVLGSVYDVLMAYLISYFKQRAWNSIGLANTLVQPLLIGAAVLLGWDITGVVLAMVFTAVFGVVMAAWQVGRVAMGDSHPTDLAAPPHTIIRRFVPYSSLSYLFNLSDIAASYVFVIFFMQGLEEAAILSVAANLARQILTYLYTPMQGLQVPLFTRARSGEGATLPGAYAAVCRLLLLLLIPGSIGLMSLARPLVLAQYPQYVAAVSAIVLLTPLLFAESLLATSQNALMVSERYLPIIVSRVLAFTSIPLAAVLVPRYGVLGAAAAIGGARVLAGLVVFVAGRRLLELKFPWAFALRLAVASAIMALVLLPLAGLLPTSVTTRGEQLGLFVATMSVAAVGGAVFLVSLRLLGGLDQRDRQQLAATRLPLKGVLLKVL